jgi:acyl-CoA-binding protein
MKLAAWRERRGLGQADAKKEYIELLTTISPGWDKR